MPMVLPGFRLDAPDVILLDLRLPDQSGLEVYEKIRKFDARIPVIFVTIAKSAEAAIDAMKQGAYDYLFKPLDLGELRRWSARQLKISPKDARAGRAHRNGARCGCRRCDHRCVALRCAMCTRPLAALRDKTCRC